MYLIVPRERERDREREGERERTATEKLLGIKYSRTSVTRTLMARLPRLFRAHSQVPRNKSFWLQIWDNLCDFLFYIENGILYVLIRIASLRRFECEHTTYLHFIENQRDPYYAS